jgi:RNA polymerase sigma-54 factor
LTELNSLLDRIELINARKTSLYQILSRLIQKQKLYMSSGDVRQLRAYSQRDLAADIGFDTSTISRAIDGRSIETPQGEEKPLQFFCPSKKDIRKNTISGILGNRSDRLTDMDIKHILKQTFGQDVSRRTVNACRNELAKQGKGGK